jgi:hypothetical protein
MNELMYSDPLTLISALELYLQQQLHDISLYDFLANKSLLKLYQCYPDQLKINIVTQILQLALMKLPSTDFMALTYLLPSKLISTNSQLKIFMNFVCLLETGKFSEFWSEYSQNKALITNSVAFENLIREFILGTISLTFHDLSLATLGAYLGYNESELSAYLSSSSERFEVDCSRLLPSPSPSRQVNGSQATIVTPPNVSKVASVEGGVRVEEVFRLLDVIRATA